VLIKFKVTSKSESKSYSYNKILKCINIKFKITSLIINILFMFFLKNILLMLLFI
jgi:hypothetical protein